MNYLKLTREKLSVEAINDLVAHDSCGAISLFAGTTRDNFEDKKVLFLEYEAYEAMAVKQMEKICHDIRKCWTDVVNIAIYHRLGNVPVREASVVIAISSPHRKSSLDAVAFAIDELKKLVPIWKKEKYEAGCSERKKRPKYDFSSCTVEEPQIISKNLIQISADENEINRRIQCFVEKKREEIDLNNILDFTAVKYPSDLNEADEMVSTCARTNSVIVKQEDSKCHLKVRRVMNRIGPQISPDYLQTLDKLMAANKTPDINIKQELTEGNTETLGSIVDQQHQQIPMGLHERITGVEHHLNVKVINTKHVYERIKAIENRLLHLESISPEYRHFLDTSLPTNQLSVFRIAKNENQMQQRKVFHVNELNAIIENMKQNECVKIEGETGESTVDY